MGHVGDDTFQKWVAMECAYYFPAQNYFTSQTLKFLTLYVKTQVNCHYLQLRTVKLEQRVKLVIRGPQSPRSAHVRSPLQLLLLLGLVRKCAVESPWGLPVVADGPASFAKEVMSELASLELENKPWPRDHIHVSAGTHSLHYYYLTLSDPGPDLPPFLAVGYVDDQPFIRYDSRVGRAESQALWMAPVDTQYWEKETEKQRIWEKVQQVEMWTVMGYHNLSSGMHSAQRMFGCEIQEDGRSNSFWQFGFNGQDHLSLDLETLSWVSAQPVAFRTKRWWETERCYAEYDKAYLQGLCLISLHRYLELGGQSLTRTEPPKVQVTQHMAQDGRTTLRCWALGFYPRDISLSWWLGQEELALETEYVETRPSGDGTYQKWAAIQVSAGEEASYTCHVQHPGLNHTLTVTWESPSHQRLVIGIVILVNIFLVVVVLVVLTKRLIPGKEALDTYRRGSAKKFPWGGAQTHELIEERLLEAYRTYTPIDPEASENLQAINLAFVAQSSPYPAEHASEFGHPGSPRNSYCECVSERERYRIPHRFRSVPDHRLSLAVTKPSVPC
ncbi:PREDICTED: BOLA class I histocompatibility antigen, alpha chain BL3-7-like [Chrysochloris asiatica]|uniref:BOLA class I histocompatibility antigen, alpha chain BL3-7-like n=1 Tax=Chrysochloris asiatica TaxID=185453 RepID=A0A9B0X2I8_CHRAS|nr:PREDICTED: BOLA class I histocompatibility antigen, alpha chain BL3-7-like [Chrysochloris asiatica]